MRLLALSIAAAILLAGCTLPDEGEPDTTYQGTCPAWVQGIGKQIQTWSIHPNSTKNEATDVLRPAMEFQNRSLDRIKLDFNTQRDQQGNWTFHGVFLQDTRATLSFFDNETGAPMEAYLAREGPDGERRHSLTWEPGVHTNFTYYIDLAAADEPVDPRRVNGEWTLERDLDDDPDTHSLGLIRYQVYGLYRTCGAD